MLKPIEHYIFKLTSFGGLAYLKNNKFIFIIGSVQKQLGIRFGNRFSFWPDLDPDSMNIRVEWLLKKKLGNRQVVQNCVRTPIPKVHISTVTLKWANQIFV